MKIPSELTSDRLIIRPFRADDFKDFYRFLSCSEATRFLGFTCHQKTRDGAKAFFDSVIESYGSYRPIFSLAIIQKEDGGYTGSCGLSPLEDGTGVECYYVLMPGYWGRGLAAEALEALFGYAFSQLRIDRIVARIHPENGLSVEVAESLGMTHEGSEYDRRMAAEMRIYVLRKNTRQATVRQPNA